MTDSNQCRCPTPPGTLVSCKAGQLAYCIVYPDGASEAGCKDPPTAESMSARHQILVVQNWVLAFVIDTRRMRLQELTSEDLRILRSGTYKDANTGREVRFSMPNSSGKGGPHSGSRGGGGPIVSNDLKIAVDRLISNTQKTYRNG